MLGEYKTSTLTILYVNCKSPSDLIKELTLFFLGGGGRGFEPFWGTGALACKAFLLSINCKPSSLLYCAMVRSLERLLRRLIGHD